MIPDISLPLSSFFSPEIISLQDTCCCLAITVKRVKKCHVDCLSIINPSCSSLIHADDISNILRTSFNNNILNKNASLMKVIKSYYKWTAISDIFPHLAIGTSVIKQICQHYTLRHSPIWQEVNI